MYYCTFSMQLYYGIYAILITKLSHDVLLFAIDYCSDIFGHSFGHLQGVRQVIEVSTYMSTPTCAAYVSTT